MTADPSRDDLLAEYLDTLPYDPYPVQEEALLSWFTSPEGVLVCAPTGTGKTLIAEAAMYEALKTGKTAYYTTPLIALTEQKFEELKEAAARWGFSEDDVGLVTGNRKVNPQAKVLVVVAEILLNRLLHPTAFDFADVSGVVMDEFHSFSDPSRGVVWELSLGFLPKHVRLLLLSATVGNAVEFLGWLRKSHKRKLELVQGTERKVPLSFQWVPDQLLNEQLEWMADGDEESRRTPGLVFCFNRAECWKVAEQLKGKSLVTGDQQKQLAKKLDEYEWSQGAGPKLKQILMRGVGVHHAGLLPKYRRIVEELFQQKLLTVAVCTETLAAGINLPARSVLLTTLLKGPKGKKKLVDASTAHQIFGRAGRPQFDTEGFVFAIPHEDDVKILRWKEKYDQIPEDTKDPQLIKAKKKMKKKMPTRNPNRQYWSEAQFEQLRQAPPGSLSSRGSIPWRLLAYLLTLSSDVMQLRFFVKGRMLDQKQLEANEKQLRHMLVTLHNGGFITLHPPPPISPKPTTFIEKNSAEPESEAPAEEQSTGTFGALLQEALEKPAAKDTTSKSKTAKGADKSERPTNPMDEYWPKTAEPTDRLEQLLKFRSVNPLFGWYLVQHMDIADEFERIQAFESLLEMAGTVARLVRVPRVDDLPPGPLATERLDPELIARGMVTPEELTAVVEDDATGFLKFPPTVAEKIHMLFRSDYPNVHELRVTPVWCVGDLLQFGGNFNKFVTGRDLTKEEGSVFRHVLRMILMLGEFEDVAPPGVDADGWKDELEELAAKLTESCRAVDPFSTEKMLESAGDGDITSTA